MVGRLLAVGVAWLAALIAFAAILQWSARQPHRPTPAQSAASALVRAINSASQRPQRWPSWAVTRATAAQRVIVLDVEAEHPEEARQIAAEILPPVRGRYDEVLIYVKAVDAARNPHVRRIQWTPRGGYVESTYDTRR